MLCYSLFVIVHCYFIVILFQPFPWEIKGLWQAALALPSTVAIRGLWQGKLICQAPVGHFPIGK